MGTKADRENVWVDLVKICCVFVVVAAHCSFFDRVYLRWITHLVRCCIQMLFIFSGYYVAKGGVLADRDKFQKYVKHLVIMLCIWLLIYIAYGMYHADKSQPLWFFTYLQVELENFCSLDSGHMWYIQNLILAVLLLYALKKIRFSLWELLLLFAVIIIFGSRLDRALCGVAFGVYFAQIQDKDKIPDEQMGNPGSENEKIYQKAWFLITAGVLALVVTAVLHYVGRDLPQDGIFKIVNRFFMNFAAIVLCQAVLKLKKTSVRIGQTGYYIRKSSTCVYLAHMLFLQWGITLASRYAAWGEGKLCIWCCGFVILFSVAFSVVLIWLSRYKWFSWLKLLY